MWARAPPRAGSGGARGHHRLHPRAHAVAPGRHIARARGKLQALDAAKRSDEFGVSPGYRLEALKGDRAGQHGIRVTERWRICLVWRAGEAGEVEIVDYHKG
ncbi:MAG: type II toxin-antitoxin system RelE/ParE family toxin [Alphaproteobacteria bacterium]